jgi:hypothetical protein
MRPATAWIGSSGRQLVRATTLPGRAARTISAAARGASSAKMTPKTLRTTSNAASIAALPAAADVQDAVAGDHPGGVHEHLGGRRQQRGRAGVVASIARARLDPAVTTGVSSAISTIRATLAGTVDPFASSTSYAFEYGRTTAYVGHGVAHRPAG